MKRRVDIDYRLNDTSLITTPFADDFNIITKNKAQHQKIIKEVENCIQSMGLEIKPSKCRSLSMDGHEKSVVIDFHLTDPLTGQKCVIEPLQNSPHKILGSLITFYNKSSDYFEHLLSQLNEKLENINKASVRGEYKLAIYSRYALPSLRFHLSVHNLSLIHI